MNNPADSNEITREAFDRILIKTRYIDSGLPDTTFRLWGREFSTPIATAALSHLNGLHEKGTRELALGAKEAGAVNFMGMESYDGELADVISAGAATVRFIKPHAKDEDVLKRIEQAKALNIFALGMDIDHAYNGCGGYDIVEGLPMKPKSTAQLRSYIEAADGIPFVIKGVLSAADAEKCLEIRAAGIVVSHHHGIMPYSVPPVTVLPEILNVTAGKIPVFVDCGFASGADVYKALALGADAVCIGRDLMGPLKENGAAGVAERIRQLNGELASIMARTGFRSLAELDASCLIMDR